jgi:uncharacterized protein YkwD
MVAHGRPFVTLVCALALGASAPAVASASSTHKHKPTKHHRTKPAAPKSTASKTSSATQPATTNTTTAGTTTTTGRSTTTATTTAAVPQVPAVCPNAQASAANTTPAALRAAVVCLVDQQRVDRGLPAVQENPLLDTSAQLWTDTMVVTQVFSHGTNFTQRLANVGYDWSNAGENIATGYETPDDAIAAWMASTGHCQNILNPDYADIGVGVNPSPVGTNVADAATWTQDFGLTMTAPYPSSNTAPMNACPYVAP